MIECPFCLSEINPAAVACAACGRDLSGHIYLLRRVADLQATIADLVTQVAGLEAVREPPTAGSPDPSSAPPPPTGRGASLILACTCVPVASLLLLHHIMTLNLDLGPDWLLAATLLLPVSFGYLALCKGDRGFVFWLFAFAIASLAAVLAINADTAMTLNGQSRASGSDASISYLPVNGREWLDDVEFAASILLSFATGLFAALAYFRVNQPDHPNLRRSTAGLELAIQRFFVISSPASLERTSRYLTSAGTVLSAAGAIYLALGKL